jgi:L-alanine-DL-glutamate epimerase-like enolase superfamily enzyme
MKMSFKPYELRLKHVFNLANSSRITTPDVQVQIEYEDIIAYGEASLPPYLGETQESVCKFLSKVDLSQFKNPFLLEDILNYVDNIEDGNKAAKASVDIALHDLTGKLLNQPLHRIWGLNPELTPYTSFTIGIDIPEIVKQKVAEAAEFKLLKVKLGRERDKEMILSIRSVSNAPICADVNQGWKDKYQALEMIYWLKDQGVILVEQPLPKEQIDDMAWLTENSPIPTIADEAFQRISDIPGMKHVYSGINIKLMKSTGLREAIKMISLARVMDLKVMIGCMTETSCAISAAAQISPLADWADLDGNLLISNDLFEGIKVIDGKITLNNWPGIGVNPL